MLIYLVVSLVAVAWLVPLIVVVLNSLRSNEEIAQTSMIGWPQHWAFGNYLTAWSDFCVAQTCAGIRPYMLNSALVTIPATIFSTLLGAVAGYAVSLWRFRGDQWIYGIVTLGIFLPQQMRLSMPVQLHFRHLLQSQPYRHRDLPFQQLQLFVTIKWTGAVQSFC